MAALKNFAAAATLGMTLLLGTGVAKAELLIYTVSDSFSSSEYTADVSGTFNVDSSFGWPTHVDITAQIHDIYGNSYSIDINTPHIGAPDINQEGVLQEFDGGTFGDPFTMQLDILTGAPGSNTSGLYPATYSGGPILETALETYFEADRYDVFGYIAGPTEVGTVTGPELSSAVPEPASLTLFGAALACLGVVKRRKRGLG